MRAFVSCKESETEIGTFSNLSGRSRFTQVTSINAATRSDPPYLRGGEGEKNSNAKRHGEGGGGKERWCYGGGCAK